MITVLHGGEGGYAQMITILHRGEGSLGTPQSDYVICAQPLTTFFATPQCRLLTQDQRVWSTLVHIGPHWIGPHWSTLAATRYPES